MFIKRTVLTAAMGLFFVLMLTACGKKYNQTAEVSSIISYSSETETTSAVTTTESSSEEITETESEEPVPAENESETSPQTALFFGRPVDEDVQRVDLLTLANKESGLYDLQSEAPFYAGTVIRMIESYGMPKKPFYNGEVFTDETAAKILSDRNLEALTALDQYYRIPLRYGILTENAAVRSFPTDGKATDTVDDKAFDAFQESMLPLAGGVIVLHQTADGTWSFVQGENYYGWIRTESIGFTDFETFKAYLSGGDFIVTLTPSLPVAGKNVRLGTVIPYEYAGNDEFLLMFPEKDADGVFHTASVPLPDNGMAANGYLEWSPETLLMMASSVIGTPYGWGDTSENYDCSSTIGLLYRCFGIYLPRNTSAMKHFGGTVLDISALSNEEKLQVIEERPGAVLVMPGHAMLYSSVWYKNTEGTEADHFVIHNTSGFYTDETAENFTEIYGVTESALENMFRANGESFVNRIQTILLFEENMADEAE